MKPEMLPSIEIAQPLTVEPADLAVFTIGRRSGEMVIAMELRFDGRLDAHLLTHASKLLLDAEPILACRLVTDAPTPRWQPVPHADRRGLVVTDSREEYEEIWRSALNATSNVQVALCLWRGEDGDQLLVQMTHEVGDGVSIQRVTARLASIYSGLCADTTYRPVPNLRGRRDFGQILSLVPKHAYPYMLWDFLMFIAPRLFPRRTQSLPLPHESIGPWVAVIKRLPAPGLSVLSTYAKARGATLNDVVLAAAYRALASEGGWDGTSRLRIVITVDLRRWCVPQAEAAAICNLSSFEYPFLVRRLGRDFDETLANVSALTRRRKRSWPGLVPALVSYLLLKRARHDVIQNSPMKERRRRVGLVRPITLSNEGALDHMCMRFGTQTPRFAHILPPFLFLPGVHICLSGYGGTLTLAAVTPQNGQVVVERFLDAVLHQLPIAPLPGLRPAAAWLARTQHLA
jgi:NRPS condensation-like uncharacterized protein